MALILERSRIGRLCTFVDERVREAGCDHSHRFARQWAKAESIDWDELLDVLEANGAHCDCEVVLNLDEDVDLAAPSSRTRPENNNPWLLPVGFAGNESATFTKIIVSRAGVGKNTHTQDGELLVPAPRGAVSKGRVRKIVNFFIGCRSGKASEIGVVEVRFGFRRGVFTTSNDRWN